MKKRGNSNPKGRKGAQVVNIHPSTTTSSDGVLEHRAKKRLGVVVVVLLMFAFAGAVLNGLWHLIWPFTAQ